MMGLQKVVSKSGPWFEKFQNDWPSSSRINCLVL